MSASLHTNSIFFSSSNMNKEQDQGKSETSCQAEGPLDYYCYLNETRIFLFQFFECIIVLKIQKITSLNSKW